MVGVCGWLELICVVDRKIVVYNICVISISVWVKDWIIKIVILSIEKV